MCLSFCFIVNSYTHCLTEKCVLTTKDKWMFSSKEVYVTHVKCVLNLWGGVTSICTSLVSLWNHLTAGNQWPLRVIVCHCECEYPFLKRIQWKTVRQAGASHALTLRLWPKAAKGAKAKLTIRYSDRTQAKTRWRLHNEAPLAEIRPPGASLTSNWKYILIWSAMVKKDSQKLYFE